MRTGQIPKTINRFLKILKSKSQYPVLLKFFQLQKLAV